MYLRGRFKNFKLEGTKFDGSWVDEDFDCDYSPVSSLFDGAGVYYEEPFTEYKCAYRVEGLPMVHRRFLRERYLRQSKIYRYEGWYEG